MIERILAGYRRVWRMQTVDGNFLKFLPCCTNSFSMNKHWLCIIYLAGCINLLMMHFVCVGIYYLLSFILWIINPVCKIELQGWMKTTMQKFGSKSEVLDKLSCAGHSIFPEGRVTGWAKLSTLQSFIYYWYINLTQFNILAADWDLASCYLPSQTLRRTRYRKSCRDAIEL